MKPVIKAENLSKQYHIDMGMREAPYTTLRETLAGAVHSPLKFACDSRKQWKKIDEHSTLRMMTSFLSG